MAEVSPATLIVNADDFGLSDMINKGIEKAHTDGILTSASLMAVGSRFDSAVDIAIRHPMLGIGAHLTLVEELPLSKPQEIPSLLGDDGRFHKSAKHFALKYLTGNIRHAEVSLELGRQLDKLTGSGLTITHVDTHQHVHLLPGINTIVSQLALNRGISNIRKPDERLRASTLFSGVASSRHIELLLVKMLNGLNWRSSMRSTDDFTGFIHGGNLNEASLLQILTDLRPGKSTELMCHPGLGPGDTDKAHWQYNWEHELQALVSPAVNNAVVRLGINLSNWNAI